LALYAFEDGYDIEQYTEFALKAAETLLLPFGYDLPRLKEYLGLEGSSRRRSNHPKSIPLFHTLPRTQMQLFGNYAARETH
jgi:hypothetical protein